MSGIFISYRRDDAQGWAGRLADSLRAELGKVNVFRDIDDIPPGADFDLYIRERVKSCQVLIVLMGPRWLAAHNAQGQRRIDAPDDFVRLEIATAQMQHLLVIPMLVGSAVMPAERDLPDDLKFITRRQAYHLSDERWNEDIAKLAATLRKALDPQREARRTRVMVAAGGAVLVAGVLALNPDIFTARTPDPPKPPPAIAQQPAPAQQRAQPQAQQRAQPTAPATGQGRARLAEATHPPVSGPQRAPAAASKARKQSAEAALPAAPAEAVATPPPPAPPDAAAKEAASWVFLGTANGTQLRSGTFDAQALPQPGDSIVAATEVPQRADDSVRPDDCIMGEVIGTLATHSRVTVQQLRSVESVTPGEFCVWAKVME